ncbi:MAG: FAD-dependent oxidoreductase [Anaerolineales bacterium]|nr:MAG: FAD-dependent oxidoreductase [Anaerolineales bacterium]
MSKPHIVILGAGPAGLGAASKLSRTSAAQVTVLEQQFTVGGNAGSFELEGVHVDYGSHRLHPACDAEVFQDIQAFLGADLLERPRHGRIRLHSRWIHFPLKPIDLALRLPPRFATGVLADGLSKLVPKNSIPLEETFASVMEKGLGRTICQDFYFPYAKKLWGLEPSELSPTQARRRVSNSSLMKMVRKVLSAVPGLKPKGSGIFYYPKRGFGQICEAYYHSALEHGAQVHLGARVTAVQQQPEGGYIIEHQSASSPSGAAPLELKADQVWSTIPITALAQLMRPKPPAELVEAARQIDYRSMILVYLVLAQSQFSQYDAHYFPELGTSITRLSEPKNYSNRQNPEDTTVLCAELPCAPDSAEWSLDDEQLGQVVLQDLEQAGIPVRAPVRRVFVRRLRFAYPVYRKGYEAYFNPLDEWAEGLQGLLSFGRQGLFAHDNTHHALYMAYSAVKCLDADGGFNKQRWQEYRKIFETHVVED